MSIEAVERVASTALANGGVQRGFRRVDWDISGSCQKPVTVVLHSQATENVRALTGRAPGRPMMEVTMETKCRKCETCLRARSQMWRHRAMAETSAAPRTWFGTLTLSPLSVLRANAQCRVALAKQGVDFDSLADAEKFSELLRVLGKNITLMFNKIRKLSGCRFRYLLVTERHISGIPHFHVLLHEMPGQPIPKNMVLDRVWALGFTKWKLADTQTAGYVCKYLSKSLEARVRASQHYGEIDNFTPETL